MASATKPHTWEHIQEQHPDEWVLLEITRHIWRTGQMWGRVVTHALDREALTDPLLQFRAAHPDAEVGVFFTGPLVDPAFDGSFVL